MTTPLIPADTGVLSVYLRRGEPPGTIVVSLEDLHNWVLTGLPPEPAPDGEEEPPAEVLDVPPPPPPPGGPGGPPPGGQGAPLPPVPARPPPQVVTVGQLDVVMAAVRQRGLGSALEPSGQDYRIGTLPIRPLALTWVKVGAANADLLKALNLYLRLRANNSSVAAPSFVAEPPVVWFGTKQLPYSRAVASHPNFERWLNEVYGESGLAEAQALARKILQGTDQQGRAIFRRLPRDDAERQARTAYRLGHNPLDVGEWLDEQDAIDAIRVLLGSAFLVMTPVPGGQRAGLLRLIGPNTGGFDPTLAIAYHATGRLPGVVRVQGSTRTLAIPGRADEIGTANPWHPYNVAQGYTGQAYFRTGQLDNDLQTVVSLAQSPFGSLDFPLVQSMLDSAAGYDLNRMPAANDHVYQTDFGPVRFQVNAFSKCWVYLVLADRLYNTVALQGGDAYASPSTETTLEALFTARSELATDTIPADRHLMAVRYERVHFGPTRESGMRYRAVEFVDLTAPLVGPPPADGLTMADWVSQWFVRFPLCGVKRGLELTDAQYQDRLKESLLNYSEPPSAVQMFATKQNEVATLLAQVNGPNLAQLQPQIARLQQAIADADTALRLRWQASLDDLRRQIV